MLDLKSFVIGFVLMLKKFTIININIYEEPCDEDYINGIILLPIIGFMVGFFASFISSFRLFYDGYFVSILVFMYYCIVTKTVNLIDVYKTLNYIIKPKNYSEQISGIIGIVLTSLLYVSLIKLVNVKALMIAFVSGYSGLIMLSSLIQREKQGTSIMKYCSNNIKIAVFVISFALAILINHKLVVPLALTYMLSGFIINLIDKKVTVLPYSIEGFIIELIQIMFLIITYMLKI